MHHSPQVLFPNTCPSRITLWLALIMCDSLKTRSEHSILSIFEAQSFSILAPSHIILGWFPIERKSGRHAPLAVSSLHAETVLCFQYVSTDTI